MADDFDADAAVRSFLGGSAPTPETALRASLQDSIGKDPDAAAGWRKTAATIGVPVNTAEALPDWSKNQAALAGIDTSAIARMNPVTTAFMSDPNNAAIAHDDIKDMGLLETLANSFRRGIPSFQQGTAAIALRYNQQQLQKFDEISAKLDSGEMKTGAIPAFEDQFGLSAMTPDQRSALRAQLATPVAGNIQTIARTQKERNAIPQPGVVGNVLNAQSFGQAFDEFLKAPVDFIASIGPESLIGSAPGMAASVVAGRFGGIASASAAMGLGSAATDYGSSIVEALGQAGVDVTNPDALATAVQDGPLMQRVSAQAIAHASVVGTVDAVSGGLASRFLVPRQVASRLAAQPVARELANLAVQTPVQGLLGGVGEAGGELAAGQDLQPGNILAEIVGESFTAPAEIASIAGKRVLERVQEGQSAVAAAERVEQAVRLAEASKLRARDPDSFRQFVDQVAESGPAPTEFYIDPQTLANTLNQSGVTMEQLRAVAPGVASQIEAQNFVPGTDVRVSVAELLTVPAEISQPLIDHLRDSPDSMTRIEATQYIDAQGDAIRAAVEEELGKMNGRQQYQVGVDTIRDQFQTQLDAAGKFTPEVNKTYATLLGNFYAAQAQRAGLAPQELFDRYQLQVSDQTPSRARRLDQAEGDARATLSFADDISAIPSVISLLAGANRTSVIHESGHFFLEVQAGLASRIGGRIARGEDVSQGERQIAADMDTLLGYFGVEATPEQSALNTWLSMSLEEKREAHETFARSFEQYAMEGKAPSLQLQEIFQHFRRWLVQVYRTLAGLNVKLSDDVRAVMDRMLATDEAIQEAEDARNMGPLFQTPEQAGMTPEEFAAYQALGQYATDRATEEVSTRVLADMKWLSRARDKFIKNRQKEVAGLRSATMIRVRAEVMSQPVYRAWQFLTAKVSPTVNGTKAKGATRTVDPERDNLFEAIGKLGGLNRAGVEKQWGIQDKLENGVFGAPVLRSKDGGMSIDAMAEQLVEIGYLLPDAEGGTDLSTFEELFADQARGVDRYSIRHDYAGEQPAIPLEDPDSLAGKLSTDEMKRRYGDAPDAIWRVLSARRMTSGTGLDPDVVAESFGYESGDEMVRALASARAPGEVIAEQTDAEMLAEHGDIASKAELDRAADEAVHNELRARVIATELKALSKATKVRATSDSLYGGGSVDVMATAARNFANEVIGRVQLRNLRPKQYAAAEARSARLAQESLGDTATAAMHKRNQLVNNFATRAAYDAQDEITKANDFFKKVLKGTIADVSKTRDAGTVQAARAILAEYGIGTKGEPAARYLQTLAADDPGMFTVLREKIDALISQAKPVAEMTVDEFRALNDEIRGLWHMAKRARQVEIDGQQMDIATVKADLIETLEARGIPDRERGSDRAVTDAERRLTKLQTARAALRRVESWVQARDGSKGIGAFRKYIWQPVKEAADAYRADKAVYIKRYKELLDTLNLGKGRIAAPELGYTFGFSRGGSGKAELLHAILHTGNESNMRKLLLGRGWAIENEAGQLDTSRWDKFVARMITEGKLTKADYDFAQGVWNLLEDTKALAQKTHRDVFGVYFDEVSANSFTNQFGTYSGGYVPAMMDPEIVKDAATRAIVEDEQQTLAYAFPSTQKGFTKARVEYNKPLLLDLRTLGSHIDKVLLFSHMERPVRDVRKVLSSNEVSELLHRVDPTAYDGLLTPWLNRAARQVVETRIPGDNGVLRFFSKMRQRAGLAAMFGNISNTAQQITGFSLAALKVKPRHLAGAFTSYIVAPRQTAQVVAAASQYMANRMDNEVQVMTDAIDQILLDPNLYEKTQLWVAKHGYFMQAAVDNVMGPIIWTGAYNQALEGGETEINARRLADSAVRETQGSTLPEDVSRIETGNTFVRMFTQFAGYFNMQANLLGTEFVNIQHELGMRKGVGKGLYVFTLGFLVPAVVAEAIALGFKGGPDDDDKDGEILDDWLMAVGVRAPIKGVFAFVPGVGQVFTAASNATNDKPYDDRISVSPAVSMLESGVVGNVKTVKQLLDGDEMDGRRVVRDLATLISITTGLPASAVARPVGYMIGVAQNKIAPTSSADALRGAVTGTPSPESKQ